MKVEYDPITGQPYTTGKGVLPLTDRRKEQLAADLHAIWEKSLLASVSGFVQDRESDINEDVQNARKVANEVLRQWPAACAERDRIIAELEGGAG